MRKNKFALYLGSIGGTELYVHWTFMLFALWVFVSSYRAQDNWNEALLSLGFLLSVFACITLHEFGHILTASKYGCPTRNITLYPIGGVASLERIPEKQYEEFRMALAGPLVSLGISGFLFLIISATAGVPAFHGMEELTAASFLYNLMVLNLALALFNLIPAFPMDGGRMLRSLLAIRFDRVKATQIAARVGFVFAVAGIVAGVFLNWWLIVIGLVVIVGARGELFMELNRAVMRNHTVGDVTIINYSLLHRNEPLDKAISIILAGREKNFIVQEDDGSFASLSANDILKGLKPDTVTPVAHLMHRNVPAFTKDIPLADAFQLMIKDGHRICPVMEHGALAGVLEMDNINEFVAFQLARQTKKTPRPASTAPVA